MAHMARHGRCNCGAVQLEVRGVPEEVGLCHCLTCRRETGSAFMGYLVVREANLSVIGRTASWTETTDHRHFCPTCGTALFATSDGTDLVEVRLGCLDDAPCGLTPTFELWTDRREPWLQAVPGATQHERDRV